MRIGSIEDFERFGRRAVACFRPKRDPKLARSCNVNNSVWSYGVIRRYWHTFEERKTLRVDHAKRRIPAISNVNDAIAYAGRGRSNRDLSSASLNFTGLESRDGGNGVVFSVDYIDVASIARRDPQLFGRAVVGEIVQSDRAVRARKRNWFEFVIRVGCAGA